MVQRQWSDWQTATIRLDDLEDIHWRQPAGAPKPLIHGYVQCTHILSGRLCPDVPVSTHPHRLLVCVLKSHTAPGVYVELTIRAAATLLD